MLFKNFNFLASADIKAFGRTCLFAMLLLIGLALFYSLLSISLLFVSKYYTILWKHIATYKADANLKLKFEKLKPTFILNTSIYVDCVSGSLCKSFVRDPSYGNYQPAV